MRLTVVILVISIAVPLCADAAMIGKNLVPNASFENRPGFKDETPRYWGSWNSDYNGISTTVRRRGQQSVYLLCPKQNDSTGVFYTYRRVKPGDKYIFSGYVLNRSDDPIRGNAFGQFSIEWRKTTRDKDNNEVLVEISRDYGRKLGPETPSIRWTAVTMSAIAPVDADACNFVVQFFNKENGGGEFFVDDLSAQEIPKSTGVKGFVLSKTRPGVAAGAATGATAEVVESEPEKEEMSIEGSLVVTGFDSGDIGSSGGIWTKDPNDKTQGCTMTYSSAVRRGNEGYSLQFDYDVDSPTQAMVGFWMVLPDLDLTRYSKLGLWLKGDDSVGFSKSVKLELKNSKKEVGRYTLTGVTKDWKKFLIPLDRFADIKDLSSVTEFVIRFDDEANADKKTGRIYLDDISFVK